MARNFRDIIEDFLWDITAFQFTDYGLTDTNLNETEREHEVDEINHLCNGIVNDLQMISDRILRGYDPDRKHDETL